MLQEFWGAHTDDKEYVALLTQATELVHNQLLAHLHQQQAGYEVQADQGKIQQATQDLKDAQDQLRDLQASINVLDSAARTLMSSVQSVINLICKWAFFAARALEIYTLADLSSGIRYDYGYIHPDIEQDWNEGLSKVGSAGRAELIAAYENSWQKFLGIATYADSYLSYFSSGNLVRDIHQLSFTDATVLANFKQTADLQFTVDLLDLPVNHFESKVEVVNVSLIGVNARTTVLPCTVEHAGKCALKKRDGTEIDMFLHPHPTIVFSTGKPLGPDNLTPPLTDPLIGPRTIAFWGRGVATTWHLVLQQDDITKYAVDLAGLTEIQVWIGYQCFLGATLLNVSPDAR
jgi:hypothetical protein